MTEEDNGTTPDPPRQGEAMQLGVQINPQSVVLSFPMSLAMDNETMGQLVEAYLDAHPEEMQKFVKKAIAQKQQELAFIEMVRQSKNN